MYKSKWPTFDTDMIQDVVAVLESGRVNQWTGSRVREFESKYCQYFGVNHAVAVFNGSVALELCLRAINIQPDEEVIVTPRTFIASASSVNICGATPVFVDVDEDSQNITLDAIQKAVTWKTRAVILVHLAGWPCEVAEIVDWCHEHDIFVIEDCAQSHGAKYDGRYLGTFGDINAWSFCQDKIITTGGEGGMVTTNNRKLYKRAWSYKDHGKNLDKITNPDPNQAPNTFRWLHDSIGTNWRMTEMQAVIGIRALDKLESWIDHRRQAAAVFQSTFENLSAVRTTVPSDRIHHAYYKYYCFIRPELLQDGIDRDFILRKLNDAGVPCFQGTCGEVYREKAYDLDLKLPVTRRLTETSLMFLVDPTFSLSDIQSVANIAAETIQNYTK